MANLLIATDDINHGSAFYALSGTNDFSYILDIMVNNGQLDEDTASEYIQTLDGYRLRFMMVGMKAALDTDDDIEAICLDTLVNGVLCAGVRNNDGALIRWAEFYQNSTFEIRADGNYQVTNGVDQSNYWFPIGEDGGLDFAADGTDDSYWSVFRFQPLRADTYTDEYRFSPRDTVTPYIYRADEDTETYTYYKGTPIELESAMKLSLTALSGALISLLLTSF